MFWHAPAKDELLHYLCCQSLQDTLQRTVLVSRAANILARLAVCPCDILTIKTVFVRYTVYHSIHNNYNSYMPDFPIIWSTVVTNTVTTAASKFEALLGSARLDE